METAGAITVLLTSAVKFLFAAPASYMWGHSWIETVVLLAVGSSAGVLAFYFSARSMLALFRERYLKRRAKRIVKGLPPKPVFTTTNRTIVRVKQRWGFWGIAAVGPPTISIPIAAVLAAKYFKHDRRTLPTMLVAVLVWAVVLSTVFSFMR